MGFDKYTKEVYTDAKKALIEEYFYGDEDLWRKKASPFREFKHIFRKLVHENLVSSPTVHAKFEGAHPSTIRASVDTEIKLQHPKLKETIERFILERLGEDQQTKIRIRLNEIKKKGYTHDDIARNFRVHESVIRKVMQGEYVAQQTLNYIYRQL